MRILSDLFTFLGCNTFFVCFVGSIEASNEDEALGKFVNYDEFSANCEMRPVVWKGEPHLCLFAVREILPDDEITFCFGDSSYQRCSKVGKHTTFHSPAVLP